MPLHFALFTHTARWRGGALSLGAALGLLLALEGAVPSLGRRWHGNGLQAGVPSMAVELTLWHPPPPARVRLPIVNPLNTHGAATPSPFDRRVHP